MVRTQAQLTEQQAEALKELARERGVSAAELIREGVELVLATCAAPTARERRERALAVVGRFGDQASDVSARHDEYFAEAIGDRAERPPR